MKTEKRNGRNTYLTASIILVAGVILRCPSRLQPSGAHVLCHPLLLCVRTYEFNESYTLMIRLGYMAQLTLKKRDY